MDNFETASKDNKNDDKSILLPKKSIEKKGDMFKRIFPSSFTVELRLLLQIYFPMLIINILRFLNPILSMMLCGHLSRLEFDAVALSVSLINILGIMIDLGFSTAFDTLFAQIYGADQKKKMGDLLQRAVVIMTLLYLITASIAINVGPLLIAFKQNSVISELAVIYLTYYWPGLYFDFMFLTISRYLQNQNIVYPMTISSVIGIAFSMVSQYIALYVYGYGIEASAIFQALSCLVMFSVQLLYMLISGIYKETWGGWSLKAILVDWKILFLLGIPGIVMTAIEYWSYEVATFVAGALSLVQLGAQSIMLQVACICFLFHFSLSIATCIRVGQYLGSSEIDRLKTSYRVAIVIEIIISSIIFILLLLFRKYIANTFTNDEEIVKTATFLMVFLSFFQYIDAIVALTTGIIKAIGRQLTGAIIIFFTYYFIGIPLGLILVFVVHMNIEGMWIGLNTAFVIGGMVFILIIYRLDWSNEAKKAVMNAGGQINISDESSPIITESDESHESLKRLIIKRCIFLVVVIVIFLLGLMLRLYVLTPSFYINAKNCFTVNNVTLKYFNTTYYRDQQSVFCANQTITK